MNDPKETKHCRRWIEREGGEELGSVFLLRRLLTTQHQRTFPAKAGVPSLLHLLTVVDDLATLAHYFASEVVSTSLISYSDCKCVLNGNLVSTR